MLIPLLAQAKLLKIANVFEFLAVFLSLSCYIIAIYFDPFRGHKDLTANL